jgi:hypothetical protein
MADHITPVGGGYHFAPRAAHAAGDWVGSEMFST